MKILNFLRVVNPIKLKFEFEYFLKYRKNMPTSFSYLFVLEPWPSGHFIAIKLFSFSNLGLGPLPINLVGLGFRPV